MKFPSLSKIPRHKRFNFEPRYYDPVKEDIKNRTERIREELKHESIRSHREHIKNAFARRERSNIATNFMQLLLILILLSTFAGWLMYGNVALYIFLVIFPLYILLRASRFFR